MNREVSVFGPSKIKDGWIAKEVFLLGEFIAKEGWVCFNGGYGGVMEYVSHGASSAGGKVIGVTVKGIPSENPYLSEQVEMDFFPRLQFLLERPRIFFSPKGSKGTLLEFAAAMVSDIMLKECNPPMIMIAAREHYMDLLDSLRELWGDQNLNGIYFVNSAMEAFDTLRLIFARESLGAR